MAPTATAGVAPPPPLNVSVYGVLAAMKYSTVPCAMDAGICASQLSPSARVSCVLVKVAVPWGRACRTATATGESLWIFERTVNSRPSVGGEAGRPCWMVGGSEALATVCGLGSFFARLGREGSLLAMALPVAAAPTANALLDDPYVAGPLPSRSPASIQYSVSAPPVKLARKVSSRSLLTICEASALPPGPRWKQVAVRTPVSSVIRASTCTWLPLALTWTS